MNNKTLTIKMQIAENFRNKQAVYIDGIEATQEEFNALKRNARSGLVRVKGRIIDGNVCLYTYQKV